MPVASVIVVDSTCAKATGLVHGVRLVPGLWWMPRQATRDNSVSFDLLMSLASSHADAGGKCNRG